MKKKSSRTITKMKKLTREQEYIIKHKGTEAPFTGKLLNNKSSGMYTCAQCGNELFSSDTKFDSGTGWPSFTEPKNKKNIKLVDDYSHGMHRVEVTCARCGGHLGHVFPDGPGPTCERYCINSASLNFKKKK